MDGAQCYEGKQGRGEMEGRACQRGQGQPLWWGNLCAVRGVTIDVFCRVSSIYRVLELGGGQWGWSRANKSEDELSGRLGVHHAFGQGRRDAQSELRAMVELWAWEGHERIIKREQCGAGGKASIPEEAQTHVPPLVCLSVCLSVSLSLSLSFFPSLCSPDYPGSHAVDQAGLELTEIHLPLPPKC